MSFSTRSIWCEVFPLKLLNNFHYPTNLNIVPIYLQVHDVEEVREYICIYLYFTHSVKYSFFFTSKSVFFSSCGLDSDAIFQFLLYAKANKNIATLFSCSITSSRNYCKEPSRKKHHASSHTWWAINLDKQIPLQSRFSVHAGVKESRTWRDNESPGARHGVDILGFTNIFYTRHWRKDHYFDSLTCERPQTNHLLQELKDKSTSKEYFATNRLL